MFKLFKKLFGKADTKIAPSPSSSQATPTSGAQKPDAASGVEVASLSLRAILDRFPADLKSTINEMPGIDAKVVLPVNAIMKQLPSGTVKMSLASLHRQAPSGTFRKTNFEEKRMVEVPLAEVFKSINPARLQRRTDQRHYEVPEEITGLFGEDGSSRSVTQPVSQIPAPAAPAATTVQPPKALKMPATTAAAAAAAPAPSKVVAPAPALKMPAPSSVVTPPARSSIIKPPAAPVSGGDALKLEGDLSISLTEAAASWLRAHAKLGGVLDGVAPARPYRPVISTEPDAVREVTRGYGKHQRPEDYLVSFERFVRDNMNQLPALQAVVTRPRDLTRAHLKELKLALDQAGYSEAYLQSAFKEARNEDIAASIIGFIRRMALGSPLVPYAERVDQGVRRFVAGHALSEPQRKWMKRFADALKNDVVLDRGAFDRGAFAAEGGFPRINKSFDGKLEEVLGELCDEVWRDVS